jgi:hypothetical protein
MNVQTNTININKILMTSVITFRSKPNKKLAEAGDNLSSLPTPENGSDMFL